MPTKISVTFNPPVKIPFTDVEGAKKAYEALHSAFSKMAGQLNTMKDDVERGTSLQAITAIATQAAESVISGGALAGSSISIRNRTETFTANTSKHISFSSGFGAIFSLASIRVLDTSGMAVFDFTITNLTAAGFDFVCPVDGTLIYLAVEET